MAQFDVILVDGDNIARRIFAVNPSGFRSQIPTFLHNLRIKYKGNVIVAWDSYPPIRRDTFSGYKAHRKKMDDEAIDVYRKGIKFLKRSFLPVADFSQFHADREEADDILATLVRTIRDKTKLVVSNDKDLLPLLNDDVSILDPWSKKKPRIKTYKQFFKDYGFHPSVFQFIKALVGCRSDGIPGVKGVGDTYAEKIIAAEGGIEWSSVWLTDCGDRPSFPDVKIPDKVKKEILTSRELVKRNNELIELRWIKDQLVCKRPRINLDQFHRFVRMFKLDREMLSGLEEYLEERFE